MDYGLSRRALLGGAAATLLGVQPAGAASGATFRGSYVLPGSTRPVPLSLSLAGGRGVLALGAGHAAELDVAVRRHSGALRLSVPGRPAPLVLEGRLEGDLLSGSVRQGGAHGRFRLRRGEPLDARAVGSYRLAGGETVAV